MLNTGSAATTATPIVSNGYTRPQRGEREREGGCADQNQGRELKGIIWATRLRGLYIWFGGFALTA